MQLFRASFVAACALALTTILHADNGAYSGSGGSFAAATTDGQSITLNDIPLSGTAASVSSSCTITSFGAGTYEWKWICSGGPVTVTSTDGSLALNGTFVNGTMSLTASGGGRGGHTSYYYVFSGTFSGTVTVGGTSEMTYGSLSFTVHATSNTLGGSVASLSLGWNSAYSPLVVAITGSRPLLLKADNLTGTNLGSYGSYGAAIGQFESISGLAHDKADRIYIADSTLNRLARIDNFSGKNWITLGSTGEGALEFSQPEGVTIDPTGKIWVADAGNNRIVRFDDMSGTNWTSFGTAGAGVNQFSLPAAIALDTSGRIYVADPGNGRLVRMDDLSGTNWTTIGQINIGPYGYPLAGINDVLILPSGKIEISTAAGWIIHIDDMTGANGEVGSWSPSVAGISADPFGTTYAAGGFTPGLAQTLDAIGTGFFGGAMGQSPLQATAVLSMATSIKPLASPTVAPAALAFASQNVGGSSEAQSITLTNIGRAPMPISSVSASSDYRVTDQCPASLAGGASCAIDVEFAPTATGARNATLYVQTTSVHPQMTVRLTGTGTAPTAIVLPGNLIFETQALNTTSSAQAVTLSNTGTGPLTITSIAASGDFGVTDTCGSSVAPGNGCTLQVTFRPTATGTRTGTLTINDDATPGGASQTVILTGPGASSTASVSWSPASILYPNQQVGTASPAQTITLHNGSASSLTLSAPVFPAGFTGTTTCGTALKAGANCTFNAQFKPAVGGPMSGALTMAIQGQPGLAVGLSGTGVQSASSSLSVTPDPVNFSGYAVGDNPSANVTISNQTGLAVGFFPVQLQGGSVFTLTGGNCPAILPGGASCTIQITFTPTAVGTFSGTLTLHEQSGAITQVPVTGTAAIDGGGN